MSHLGNSPLPIVPWATGLDVDPEVPGAVPGASESSDWSYGRSLPLRCGWDPDCPAAGRRRPGGRGAEPVQRPDRGDDRPGTGDAGPERGAEEEGAKKALPAGNVQSRKVWV